MKEVTKEMVIFYFESMFFFWIYLENSNLISRTVWVYVKFVKSFIFRPHVKSTKRHNSNDDMT